VVNLLTGCFIWGIIGKRREISRKKGFSPKPKSKSGKAHNSSHTEYRIEPLPLAHTKYLIRHIL
jgi:hypothetical protein